MGSGPPAWGLMVCDRHAVSPCGGGTAITLPPPRYLWYGSCALILYARYTCSNRMTRIS